MINSDNCPPKRRAETGAATAPPVAHDVSRASATDGSRKGGSNRDRGEKEVAAAPQAKKTRGRVKIDMRFINNRLRRCTTFSKRKTGIMKKAKELATLTGTQIFLVVASETGHVYSNATYKFRPMLDSDKGRSLIRACLASPDPPPQYDQHADPRISLGGFEEPTLSGSSQQQPTPAAASEVHAKDDLQLTFNEASLPATAVPASSAQSVSPAATPTSIQPSGVQPYPINYLQTAGSNYTQLANGYTYMPAENVGNSSYWYPLGGMSYRADEQFAFSQGASAQLQLSHTQDLQGYLTMAPPGSDQSHEEQQGGCILTELQSVNMDAAHYTSMQGIYNTSSMV